MKGFIKYISEIINGMISLLKGMSVTGKYFITSPKTIVTQQYPENRDELKMFDRFKGEVTMPHNENNEHRCTGCGICAINCPNNTITVTVNKVEGEDGKTKRELDKHIYRLSMCSFCGLCVKTCPSDALAFGQEFEHAVFNKEKLVKQLNQEGSKLMKGVK